MSKKKNTGDVQPNNAIRAGAPVADAVVARKSSFLDDVALGDALNRLDAHADILSRMADDDGMDDIAMTGDPIASTDDSSNGIDLNALPDILDLAGPVLEEVPDLTPEDVAAQPELAVTEPEPDLDDVQGSASHPDDLELPDDLMPEVVMAEEAAQMDLPEDLASVTEPVSVDDASAISVETNPAVYEDDVTSILDQLPQALEILPAVTLDAPAEQDLSNALIAGDDRPDEEDPWKDHFPDASTAVTGIETLAPMDEPAINDQLPPKADPFDFDKGINLDDDVPTGAPVVPDRAEATQDLGLGLELSDVEEQVEADVKERRDPEAWAWAVEHDEKTVPGQQDEQVGIEDTIFRTETEAGQDEQIPSNWELPSDVAADHEQNDAEVQEDPMKDFAAHLAGQDADETLPAVDEVQADEPDVAEAAKKPARSAVKTMLLAGASVAGFAVLGFFGVANFAPHLLGAGEVAPTAINRPVNQDANTVATRTEDKPADLVFTPVDPVETPESTAVEIFDPVLTDVATAEPVVDTPLPVDEPSPVASDIPTFRPGFDDPGSINSSIDDLFADRSAEPEAAPVPSIDPQVIIAFEKRFEEAFGRLDDIEKAIAERDAALIARDEAIAAARQAADDAITITQAQEATIVEVVRISDKMILAEQALVDLSERIAVVENVNPADRTEVNRQLEEVNRRMAEMARDVSLVARMAINGGSQAGLSAPVGGRDSRIPGTAHVYGTASGAIQAVPGDDISEVPADVKVGDIVGNYGKVLEIIETSNGDKMIVMERKSLIISG